MRGSNVPTEVAPRQREDGSGAHATARKAHSVVVGGESVLDHPQAVSPARFRLGEQDLVAALVATGVPDFDPDREADAERVLIEVDVFSCNYRDRGILLRTRARVPAASATPTGSEFCARLIAAGRAVGGLSVGDRVFAANAWPEPMAPGLLAGLPTDHASRRHHRLHYRQLARVPDTMSDEEAAAFTIGAQTGYALVRRVGISAGDVVLVTAASSATSQFVISRLRNDPAQPRVVAITTSGAGARAAADRGAHDVLLLEGEDARACGREGGVVAEVSREVGGFAAIIDPLFDIHFPQLSQHLRQEGRYISCGYAGQYEGAAQPGQIGDQRAFVGAMRALGSLNASILGHCLGTWSDLDRAIADYEAGQLTVPIDSVHTGPPAPFLERSWLDRSRVGKVVYRYERV